MTVPRVPSDDDWTPERLADLSTTIAQLWPNSEPDGRTALVQGLSMIAARSRLAPSVLFSGVVDVAEAGRSSLPNVGTIMRAVDDARNARLRREADARGRERIEGRARSTGPEWTASLWFAVFVNLGGRERFRSLPIDTQERLRPYCRIVHELNLTPEHNRPGDPLHDPERVALANERAGEIWRTSGGIGPRDALAGMSGRRRRF